MKAKTLGMLAVAVALTGALMVLPGGASKAQSRVEPKSFAITDQELSCTQKCNGQRGGCGNNPPATRKCYNACMGRKVCPEN
jgi:hypothetical protein